MLARTQDNGNKQVLLERLTLKCRPDNPAAALHTGPGWARWEVPEEVSSVACQVSSEEAEDPEEIWEKVASGECEISNGSQVLDNKWIRSDCPQDHTGETKPIPAVTEAREVVVAPSGAAERPAAVAAGRQKVVPFRSLALDLFGPAVAGRGRLTSVCSRRQRR